LKLPKAVHEKKLRNEKEGVKRKDAWNTNSQGVGYDFSFGKGGETRKRENIIGK